MQITMNDLTVDFAHVAAGSLLEDWAWLLGENLVPILITSAGDAFLQSTTDGSVSFLDVQSGEVGTVAASVEELRSLLADGQFVRDYLAVDMVADLISNGQCLAHGQVYDLAKPLVLGGQFELDNIVMTDMAVHFSVLGQIHEQVSKLPPGTKISGVTGG